MSNGHRGPAARLLSFHAEPGRSENSGMSIASQRLRHRPMAPHRVEECRPVRLLACSRRTSLALIGLLRARAHLTGF
jgi:hypothetical protein